MISMPNTPMRRVETILLLFGQAKVGVDCDEFQAQVLVASGYYIRRGDTIFYARDLAPF